MKHKMHLEWIKVKLKNKQRQNLKAKLKTSLLSGIPNTK